MFPRPTAQQPCYERANVKEKENHVIQHQRSAESILCILHIPLCSVVSTKTPNTFVLRSKSSSVPLIRCYTVHGRRFYCAKRSIDLSIYIVTTKYSMEPRSPRSFILCDKPDNAYITHPLCISPNPRLTPTPASHLVPRPQPRNIPKLQLAPDNLSKIQPNLSQHLPLTPPHHIHTLAP